MTFKSRPTDYYTPEQIESNQYLDLGVNGLSQKVTPVDALGNIIGGLNIPAWDYMSRTLSAADTETYVFKTGGSGGTTVSTVVVVYTSSSLQDILTVTKT